MNSSSIELQPNFWRMIKNLGMEKMHKLFPKEKVHNNKINNKTCSWTQPVQKNSHIL